MGYDLEKVENRGVALAEPQLQGETILASDIVIPKVLLMQGLSEYVNERKAQQGDIVRSTNAEKLADPDRYLELIPLTFKNTWIEFEIVGGKPEFRGSIERNAKNENDPWEFQKNGMMWKRMKSVDLYALLPSDVDAEIEAMEALAKTGELPDLDKSLLPVVVSFRSTSFKAGRNISTHWVKTQKFKLDPYQYKVELSCFGDKNEKGSFYVFDLKTGSATDKKYYKYAQEWRDTLLKMGNNIKVHEELEQSVEGDDDIC